MTAAEKIKEMGIVPVVVLEDEKDAGALAKALCEGGLSCAEVTFRTAAAHHAGGISGDVRGSRNCSDNTAGG